MERGAASGVKQEKSEAGSANNARRLVTLMPSSALDSAFWEGGDRATIVDKHSCLRVVVEDPKGGDQGSLSKDDASSPDAKFALLLLRENITDPKKPGAKRAFYTAGRQANRATNEDEPDARLREAKGFQRGKSAELWERRGKSFGGPGDVKKAWRQVTASVGSPSMPARMLTDNGRRAMAMWALDGLLHRATTLPSQETRFYSRSTAAQNPTVRGTLREIVNLIRVAARPDGATDLEAVRAGAVGELTRRIMDLAFFALATSAYHLHMTDALVSPSTSASCASPRSPAWLLNDALADAVIRLFTGAVSECAPSVRRRKKVAFDSRLRVDVVLSMDGVEAQARGMAERILKRCVGALNDEDYERHLRAWGKTVASAERAADSLGELLAAAEANACASLVQAYANQRESVSSLIRKGRSAAASAAPPSPLTNPVDAVFWRALSTAHHLEKGIDASERPSADAPFTVGLLDAFHAKAALRAAAVLWANAPIWDASQYTLLISDAYRIKGLEYVARDLLQGVTGVYAGNAMQAALLADWLTVHGLQDLSDEQSYASVAARKPILLERLNNAASDPSNSASGLLLGRALQEVPALFFFGAPIPESIYLTGRSSANALDKADLDVLGAHKKASLGPPLAGLLLRGEAAPMGALPLLDRPSLDALHDSLLDSFHGQAVGLEDEAYRAFMILHANPVALDGEMPEMCYCTPGRPKKKLPFGRCPVTDEPLPRPDLDGFLPDIMAEEEGDAGTSSPGELSPYARLLRTNGLHRSPGKRTSCGARPSSDADSDADADFLTEGMVASDVVVSRAPTTTIEAYISLLHSAPGSASAAITALKLAGGDSLMPGAMTADFVAALEGQLVLARRLVSATRVITSYADPVAVAAEAVFSSADDVEYAPLPPVAPPADALADIDAVTFASQGLQMARPMLVIDRPASAKGAPAAEVLSAALHVPYLTALAEALVAATRFRVVLSSMPELAKGQPGVAKVEREIDGLLSDVAMFSTIETYIKTRPVSHSGHL